jgi:hypothetical protein
MAYEYNQLHVGKKIEVQSKDRSSVGLLLQKSSSEAITLRDSATISFLILIYYAFIIDLSY